MSDKIYTMENTYSRKRALEVLKRSQQYIYDLVDSGRLTRCSIGREIRYSKFDIAEVLRERGEIITIGIGRNSLKPIRATEGSAGIDIGVILHEDYDLKPQEIKKFNTGIRLYLPDGTHGEIVSRSSTASNGIIVLNSPAIIDSDYMGEVKLLLMNVSNKTYRVKHKDRSAQCIIAQHYSGEIAVMEECDSEEVIEDDSIRGVGGFGSTGR